MRNICKIEGCDRTCHGQGYCKMHHLRVFRYGDPHFVKLFRGDPEAAFWSRVDKDGPDHPELGKCWTWTGGTKGEKRPSFFGEMVGYGCLTIKNRCIGAHRFCWELHFGKIPEGMSILHKCDNTICVNPDHLFVGTHDDNMTDKANKGRCNTLKGEDNASAKLADEQVLEIRRRYRGRSKKNGAIPLAKEFGVSYDCIKSIVYGVTWAHLLPKKSAKAMGQRELFPADDD